MIRSVTEPREECEGMISVTSEDKTLQKFSKTGVSLKPPASRLTKSGKISLENGISERTKVSSREKRFKSGESVNENHFGPFSKLWKKKDIRSILRMNKRASDQEVSEIRTRTCVRTDATKSWQTGKDCLTQLTRKVLDFPPGAKSCKLELCGSRKKETSL